MTTPIELGGDAIDLGGRVASSTTIVASPSAAVETIIAQITLPSHIRASEFVLLDGWAAFTVGGSGTSVRLRIRRTNVSGQVLADTGALTGGVAAGNLLAQDVSGQDGSGTDVYVLTLTVGAAVAASTVSALRFSCLIF